MQNARYRNRFDIAENLIDRHLSLVSRHLSYEPLRSDVSIQGPCVYLLRYEGRHGLYRSGTSSGSVVYVGSAQSASRRLAEHLRSLEWAIDLSPTDFTVGFVPATSVEMSRYLEARLIILLDPPWNRRAWAGFGSKPQGRTRQHGQRRSAWDRLHPGRPWAATRKASAGYGSEADRSDHEHIRRST